jgi:hypothetical protein
MSDQRDGKPTAASEAHRYRIVPVGNGPSGGQSASVCFRQSAETRG